MSDIKNWLKKNANPLKQQSAADTSKCSISYNNAASSAEMENFISREEKNEISPAQIHEPKTAVSNKVGRRRSYPMDASSEQLRIENDHLNDEIDTLRGAIYDNQRYGHPFKACHMSKKKSQVKRAQRRNLNNDDIDFDNMTDAGKLIVAAFGYSFLPIAVIHDKIFQNRHKAFPWFIRLLFSYFAMCFAINVVVLVIVGWRPFFHSHMWLWSAPGFLSIILATLINMSEPNGEIGFYANHSPIYSVRIQLANFPGQRKYYCPHFACRLRLYWAITTLLFAAVIIFFVVRHFLLGPPLVWTTSPEAIFPSTLKLDCPDPDEIAEAKARRNLTLADDVTANDEGKGSKKKCDEDDALITPEDVAYDEIKQRKNKCDQLSLLLLSLSFIVAIVDLGFCLAYQRDYE